MSWLAILLTLASLGGSPAPAEVKPKKQCSAKVTKNCKKATQKCTTKKAKAKDTGARGLRSIVEEIMLDVMYELPDKSEKEKGRYVITPEIVRKEKNLFDTPPIPIVPEKRKKESA